VSANPRIVLSDTWLQHDGVLVFVRKGTMVDAPPGSALETAYGGSSNLRGLTAGEVGDGESSARSFQHN
jgi:hypothetical protein